MVYVSCIYSEFSWYKMEAFESFTSLNFSITKKGKNVRNFNFGDVLFLKINSIILKFITPINSVSHNFKRPSAFKRTSKVYRTEGTSFTYYFHYWFYQWSFIYQICCFIYWRIISTMFNIIFQEYIFWLSCHKHLVSPSIFKKWQMAHDKMYNCIKSTIQF